MMDYWNQLKPSERTIISVGGIILAVLILYLAVLEPFMLKSDEFTTKVAQQKTQIEWLKKKSLEVKQLQASSSGGKRSARKSGESLLVVVDRTAKQNRLADSLKRVEPDGSERVRVWLDNASFDEVAKWLSLLQSNYQLDIESAVFDKVEAAGRVNVRLVIIEGGA